MCLWINVSVVTVVVCVSHANKCTAELHHQERDAVLPTFSEVQLEVVETYTERIFLTLKSSSGATSGLSPLSVCRTSCWMIRSSSTQYCSMAPLCLSTGTAAVTWSTAAVQRHVAKGVEICLQGMRRQCWSADSRWGYASVWIRFFLIWSNIWLALFVSTWTWSKEVYGSLHRLWNMLIN